MSSLVGTHERELQDIETIGFVASALFDVSAEKIGRLRAAFDKNSMFYDNIARLYQAVKQSAFERGELPSRPATTTKTVSVAFTTNTRFYGSVNAEVIAAFIAHMQSGKESDYIVIGRTGKALVEAHHAESARCAYYTFTEDEPTGEEIRQFLKHVAAYEQVLMVYPSFLNIFVNTVATRDITYTPHGAEANRAATFEYIFEPELPKILSFFETKVRYLLFERAMLEAELARTAARLFSMNEAQERSDTEVTHLRRTIRRTKANFNDMRLLESFSAISKWKT